MGQRRDQERWPHETGRRRGWLLSRIERLAAARRDVDDIWLHLARFDIRAADALIDRMEARLRLLADNPRLGRRRTGYGDGLRSFTVTPYILFYQPLSDGIRLIRVLHGARDMRAIIDAD